MRRMIALTAFLVLISQIASAATLATPAPGPARLSESADGYPIGVGDVLEISVLQPDQFTTTVTVGPDGAITFPYIGSVRVKGKATQDIQNEIQKRLADGYIKYPVVTVYLRESRSRKYLVSGEVMKPGSYPLEDNTTVLRAISIAGGFSKFGSASRVKVLRERRDGQGYETIKLDLKRAMDGQSDQDLSLRPGDMVIVSEGIF